MRILVLSPRVAPGLMTLKAWDALREASTVFAPAGEDPHIDAIIDAGIEVQLSDKEPTFDAAVLWIVPAGDMDSAQAVKSELAGGDDRRVEIITGSFDPPGARFLDLVRVMDQLRIECPWTSVQTHASLSHFLLEETYETLEALDLGDSDHLCEELGDLLMNIVFHARIAAESEGWDIDSVADGVVTKLINRNPHVFGDAVATSAHEIDANWQKMKKDEKNRPDVLDGIPEQLPALAYADKVLSRTGNIDISGRDIGHRLLAVVQESREAGVDAEESLRKVVRTVITTAQSAHSEPVRASRAKE